MSGPPETPRPASRSEPVVRGFLFADLRGYTAFVERAGDVAAADHLDRYRTLVRSVIEDQAGAEIRTEGDSFYVVFPSPSAAVRAGLELVTRAASDSEAHPRDPIRVGVGIHAGESAETSEGYVGSAVNLAARICSVAKPGEVLVSATVRSLARTSLPVRYVPRGRPTLKGVSEPIELFAVQTVDGVAGIPPVESRRIAGPSSPLTRIGLIGVGAVAVALAVAGIAAISAGPGGTGSPSPSPGPSSGEGSSPSASVVATSSIEVSASAWIALKGGPLDAGTYRTTRFSPALTFTVPDGWFSYQDESNRVVLGLKDDPMRRSFPDAPGWAIGGRLSILRPTVGISPCTPTTYADAPWPSGSTTVEIPQSRDGFIGWAKSNGSVVLGNPSLQQIGRLDAASYQVELSTLCDGRGGVFGGVDLISLQNTPTAHTNYRKYPNGPTTWLVGELDGQTILIAIDALDEEPDFEAAARSVLTSLARAD